MPRPKEDMDATSNATVYRRRYKQVVCNKTGKCDFCPWHAIENRRRSKRTPKPKKNNHRCR